MITIPEHTTLAQWKRNARPRYPKRFAGVCIEEDMWMASERRSKGIRNPRVAFHAAAMLLSLLTLGMSQVAHAQEAAGDYVEPRIERQQFEAFMKRLSL